MADDLRTAEGRPVAGATVWVETGDHPPALRAPSSSLLLADPAAPLPIAATNAPPGRTLEVAALGRSHGSAAIPVPDGSSNVDMPLDDRQTRRALRDGGWVRWTVPATGTDWGRRAQSLQIAAPQLDVIAIAAADEVLVWINDLETGDGVPGANAELMRHGVDGDATDAADFAPVTVATARSDADGIARIKLPDGYLLDRQALARNEWFVRAEAGRGRNVRRAVLPLGSANRLVLANPGRDRAWGVTDRPLYRAGDTVRFRLWQRADRAGQLEMPRSPDLSDSLHLMSVDEDKLIRSWPASPDASDGWIGEVVLPLHANDGAYCVTPFEEPYRSEEGACFFVGTYRAQDLWAEASAHDGVLREDDIFKVEISGGYYSGGPAAGVGLRNITTMLTGLPLSRAYPEFAAFTFVDVMSEQARGGIPLRPVVPPESTDADGHLEIEVPVTFNAEAIQPDQLPAFGQLQVAAELALDSREGTVTNAAAARFTRHDAFVGLRVEPRWLDAQTPVRAEAVVIDADGTAVPGQVIDVEVDFLAGFQGEPQPQRIGACQLRGGVMQACDFPRTRSGRYRLTARSGDAAPAALVQYVWSGDRAPPAALAPILEVAQPPAELGAPVKVVLRQVEVGRPVLFVIFRNGRVLAHMHARTRSSAGLFDLPLPAGIDGDVELAAYLRSPPDASSDGHLSPPRAVETATTTFEVPATNQAPVAIAFEHAQVEPGERTSLTVHNLSDGPRSITVSVMGDALRALAGDYLEYSDPHGPFWLGKFYWRGAGSTPSLHDFGAWNSGPEWTVRLDPLPGEPPVIFDDAAAPPAARATCRHGVGRLRIARAGPHRGHRLSDQPRRHLPRREGKAGCTDRVGRNGCGRPGGPTGEGSRRVR
ncbi:hypothetical protein [Alkalisalibacterium limincola]|uniref:hypothetical protein n=1 Tax=Alkalisalibacterium limincola TaxID=2699169 RepID=UPI0016501E16|nr:hypothetical protein [Alkalisalibacterium limincola]